MLKGLDGWLLRIFMFILAKQSEMEGMSCRYYELRVIDLATVQLETLPQPNISMRDGGRDQVCKSTNRPKPRPS